MSTLERKTTVKIHPKPGGGQLIQAGSVPSHAPSVRSANWLYLLSMGLIVILGSLLQSPSMSWGLLATELGLILLPALLFMWRGRLAPRPLLRLRWPGWRLVALGAVVGAGVWGLDIGLQALAVAVLGYSPPSLITALQADFLSLGVFALALGVVAPVCEEIFFRGYLLSAYRRYRPVARLWIVALLFAFFHLQFEGLLALLPIALALGFLAQRSHSLAPAIAAHVANNSLAAGLTIALRLNPALSNGQSLSVALGSAMLMGPVIALVGLWAFARLTRPPRGPAGVAPTITVEPAPAATARAGERGAFWPLAAAAVIYVVCAGLELVMGRFPALLAQPTLRLQPAPWTQPTHLAYTLWNVANEPVGAAECWLTPESNTVAFECVTRQQHFEVRQGASMYAGGTYELLQTGRWEAESMRLLEAEINFEGEFSSWSARVGPSGSDTQALSLRLGAAAPRPLPDNAVIAAEWPWRLMALPFGQPGFFGSKFNQVLLAAGAEDGQLTTSVALVRGEEDVLMPNGHARAWKVEVGSQTAWYALEVPHTLLRFSDGYGVTWTLLDVQPAASIVPKTYMLSAT